MKSSNWYYLIAIISVSIFSFTLWKKRDKKLLALYFFTAGLTYFLEYIALVLFKSYKYNPEILKNEYFDNIMGAVFSDAFSIPMTTIFVVGFKLNFKNKLLVSVIIILVEIFFTRLGIYKHFWWRMPYTFIGSIIFFSFAQKWFSIIKRPINRFVRFVTLYFSNLVIQASAVFVIAALLHLYLYRVDWFADPNRGHIAFATLYILFVSIIFVTLIVFHMNWIYMGIGLIIPSVIDYVLIKVNILQMSEGWSLINFLILRVIILVILYMFNKYLLSGERSRKFSVS